jgi:CBS domain-containing protein
MTAYTRMRMPKVVASRRWMLLSARDLMRTDVVTVDYDTPVSELVEILTDHRVSGVPVTIQSGQIVGVVSLRDVIDRYPEYRDAWPTRTLVYRDPENDEPWEPDGDEDADFWARVDESGDTAGDIMTREVITVPDDAGVCEIAALMVELRIHRVVVERGGVHLGIISTLDILDALTA